MALSALKKITIKDVMKGKPERETIKVAVLNEDGSQLKDGTGAPVMRDVSVAKSADVAAVYGRARTHRTGSTSFGEFVEYIGTFEARRLKDGEIFQSTRIIFPPIAADLADMAYADAKRNDPNADVEFAFIVGIEPDVRGVEGYKWTCKPIRVGAVSNDPLGDLRSSLAMDFAEVLGAETMALIGMPIGNQAKQIGQSSTTTDMQDRTNTEPHDSTTGEVIEGTSTDKTESKKANAKTPV